MFTDNDFIRSGRGTVMELWHEAESGDRVKLASDVEVATSWLTQARGRMFTRQFPSGSALVFPFDGVERRSIHMVAVPYPLDVIWLVDDEVTAVKRLRPMIGMGWAPADTVIELPAGGAKAVAVGDSVYIE